MTSSKAVYGTASLDFDTMRIVFVVAHAGALFQCLARTMQDRLRGSQVYVTEADGALPDLDHDPQLALIDANCSKEMSGLTAACRAHYPNTAIALLLDENSEQADQCDMLFAAGKVQGILPWALKLDVWLAALSLLMSGGEYYPAQSLRQGTGTTMRSPSFEPKAANNEIPALPCLTARESQILELIAEGYQNKLIAHRMSLSVHTVKVHVHNLLSKLQVTNRTQAAAAYRRKFVQRPASPAKRPAGSGGFGVIRPNS
ncbi:response regulator transcription factor [Chelativorans sp. Marseille-P2723]|uniref:response regulator transcription factor n=1 Tax=Chelativorans sp. Marseille-P2723 TaxID=2709133 RepID=UPI00157157AE|nr:response regulator transcription factor [Chelativorans sp. Marseille-P2723]